MTVKHATASVFLFTRSDGGWRLGLVHHNRFAKWMLPGGHVEADENPAQAALREVREETGLAATLLASPATPLPTDFQDPVVPTPFWIVEEQVPGDREPYPHVHVDFLYVALAGPADRVSGDARGEDLEFTWHTAEQLPGLDMFEATRLFGADLFNHLDALTVAERTI